LEFQFYDLLLFFKNTFKINRKKDKTTIQNHIGVIGPVWKGWGVEYPVL
jgi:hypothetical protein